MRKFLFVFVAMLALSLFSTKSYAQLSDEQYNYVTMDLRGILTLTMTTNPQVDFVFSTVQEYMQGITRFNAVELEVDATMAWDLFVYASTDGWEQVESYSINGNNFLPAEILEMQSSVTSLAPVNLNAFESLKGATNSEVSGNLPTAATQFLAGQFGTLATESFAPGTASGNPDTHRFRLDMRLVPDIPATFPNSTVLLDAGGNNATYAQAGYYYLEVVYSLVEDL
ncbi:MAG: hypothetical protein ACOC12_02410 [Bacteroidota bacterium]